MECSVRIGYGYDIHRFDRLPPHGNGQPFALGGFIIHHDLGPVGKTDADVLLHSITDALLGASALGSMSTLFSLEDPQRLTTDSSLFLREALRRINNAGWSIGNLDTTIVLENPRIAPFCELIRAELSKLLSVQCEQISVKAKTHEGLDSLGKGMGVEAHASVLLYKAE